MAEWQDEIDELNRRRAAALEMGGPEKVARQHGRGKLDVRQRIAALTDPGSFREIGALAAKTRYEDGQLVKYAPANFVLGTARIDGRTVVIAADDFTVRGGASDGAIVENWKNWAAATCQRCPASSSPSTTCPPSPSSGSGSGRWPATRA